VLCCAVLCCAVHVGDFMRDFSGKLVPLLEDNVRVMIYAGDCVGRASRAPCVGGATHTRACLTWHALRPRNLPTPPPRQHTRTHTPTHTTPPTPTPGDQDLICNWLGNRRWLDVLEWAGAEGWSKAADKPWRVAGKQAGTVTTFDTLSFVKVFDAVSVAGAGCGRWPLWLVRVRACASDAAVHHTAHAPHTTCRATWCPWTSPRLRLT
jgi:hypothetical protein